MGKHSVDNAKSHFAPGTGLSFESEDGEFALKPRLRAQLRYTLIADEGEESLQSLQFRRARLQFKGHTFGKHNKFKVELAISPRDVGESDSSGPSTSPLLDWYWTFNYLRDLTLTLGQYKIPHNRQRVVSSGDLQLVDRSIVNSEFTLDRDIGFDLRSKDLGGLDLLRYYVGVYAGEGRNTREEHDFGLLYLARVEVLPFGMFDDYQEVDFERSPTPKLSIGLGYAHLENGRGSRGILGSPPADGGTTDLDSFTWDLVFRVAGLSVTSEWVLRNGRRNPGDATQTDDQGNEVAVPTQAPPDGIGGMLQVGYLFPRTRFEIAARAGATRRVGDHTSLVEEDEYGGGVSYYFAQHPFKLQADYFRLGQEIEGGKNFENEARVQLQVAF